MSRQILTHDMDKSLVEKISEKFLWFFYYYMRFFGIFVGYLEKRSETDNWHIRRSSKLFMHFCIFIRLLGLAIFLYFSQCLWIHENKFVYYLYKLEFCGIFISSLGIVIAQIWLRESFIAFVRNLYHLYRRVNYISLPSIRFVDKQFCVLLIFKWFFMIYEVLSSLNWVFDDNDLLRILSKIYTEIFLTAGVTITFHAAFIVYMMIGQCYRIMNRSIYENLCPRVRILNYSKSCHKQLTELTNELDEYIGIFDEINKVSEEFHRLFEIPLSYMLLVSMAVFSVVIYHMIGIYFSEGRFEWEIFSFMIKAYSDVLLLTLAAHSSAKSSEIAKKCGLDSVYVREDAEWHQTVEIFLNRLNLYEFKPNLLGLIDISNEMNLMFLSAIVTYLTFILQYSMQFPNMFAGDEFA